MRERERERGRWRWWETWLSLFIWPGISSGINKDVPCSCTSVGIIKPASCPGLVGLNRSLSSSRGWNLELSLASFMVYGLS